jgi:ABC-type phosphate/phosphonate transport system substrate-binding protein
MPFPATFKLGRAETGDVVILRRFAVVGVAVFAALLSGTARADEKPVEMKIGLVQGLFRDVQPAMMQALAKPFRDLMAKQTGYSGDVEICPDAIALAQKMKEKQLPLGVFHGFEFAWAQKVCPELLPLIITIPPGSKVQACIVVGKDCEANGLCDLKDECVVIPRGAKGHSLAFLTKARDGLAKTVAKPLNKTSLTAEDALNAIACGELTAALIDSAALEGYQTLQPGAFKSLKILAKSEEFPPAVVAYRKGMLSDDQVNTIRTGMAGAQKTPTGKMLMTLWNLKGFEPAPELYQSQLDAILKAYPLPQKPTVAPVGGTGGQ